MASLPPPLDTPMSPSLMIFASTASVSVISISTAPARKAKVITVVSVPISLQASNEQIHRCREEGGYGEGPAYVDLLSRSTNLSLWQIAVAYGLRYGMECTARWLVAVSRAERARAIWNALKIVWSVSEARSPQLESRRRRIATKKSCGFRFRRWCVGQQRASAHFSRPPTNLTTLTKLAEVQLVTEQHGRRTVKRRV